MRSRVDQLAAEWALRDPLTAEQEQALNAWLAEDRRHAGALLRARAALHAIDDALAPDAGAAGTPLAAARRPTRRSAIAAGIVAAVAVVAGLIEHRRPRGNRVVTARGEIRRLPLTDGSVAVIDTGSALRIAFAGSSRHVSLEHGQAWFQVAKDRHRPFVVDAGIVEVRALGTAFAVTRSPGSVHVAVTEGTVAAWGTAAGGAPAVLRAGQTATFAGADASPEARTEPDAIDQSLAWRNGEIVLQNDTLGAAAAQFNRYNTRPIVIDDDGLRAMRLVGLFQLDDPGAFARTVAATFNCTVIEDADRIRLLRNKSARSLTETG